MGAEQVSDESDQAVLAALRQLIGEEALGRLMEAAKIDKDDPIVWLRRAIDDQSTLRLQEQAGWEAQLVRRAEIRPFRIT